MSMIVEDGSLVEDANSYLTVAEASALLSIYSTSTSFDAADEEDQERALILASDYVDLEYGPRLMGYLVESSQAMMFPRRGIYYQDVEFSETEIPSRLKRAVALLAKAVIDGRSLIEDQATPDSIKQKMIKVGPITIMKEYLGGTDPTYQFVEVGKLMSVFISMGASWMADVGRG